jgi:hypothetical protein
MKMPGFSAETSHYRTSGHYYAIRGASAPTIRVAAAIPRHASWDRSRIIPALAPRDGGSTIGECIGDCTDKCTATGTRATACRGKCTTLCNPGTEYAGGTAHADCWYGHWCGPLCGLGDPIDDVDACCETHDKCYATRGYLDCRCDLDLLYCLSLKINPLTEKGRWAAAMYSYFSLHACVPHS